MRFREFGRLGWDVSEVGYGMWAAGGQWGGTNDEDMRDALVRSVELGCNFFDTAWQYGNGHSERLLGDLIKQTNNEVIRLASKIPPVDFKIPAKKGSAFSEVFPSGHVRRYLEYSLQNLGVDHIDLMQFHTWQDSWAGDESCRDVMESLKRQGLVKAWGICANRWEPSNCTDTLATGLIDSVQITYNIFEQAPQDEVLQLCQELGVAVIARVPFDEGSLTGTLSQSSTWKVDDWRRKYFSGRRLRDCVERADALSAELPPGISIREAALGFVLANPAVSTVVPGMRSKAHVEQNIACSGLSLSRDLLCILRQHRWDRNW
jgi:aryl-alcohol dehydrogenase-like predicted oxidoreductase